MACENQSVQIFFIETIENNALQNISQLPLFKRYVDNCFVLKISEEQSLDFLQALNAQHPDIKFEIEHPKNQRSLSLRDFTVTISSSNEARSEFYKKADKKNIFVHSDSHMPTKTKINFIINEKKRISDRCSDEPTRMKHKKDFDDLLRTNGYSEQIIKSSERRMQQHKNQQN